MSKIYRGDKWHAHQVGEIDTEGRVYEGPASAARQVGWVDPDGQILRGNKFVPDLVGWIDAEGQVLSGDRFTPSTVGWVDKEGHALAGDRFAPSTVGDTEPPSREGAAAFLLLFHEEKPDHPFLKAVATAGAGALLDKVVGQAKRSRNAPIQPSEPGLPRGRELGPHDPMRRVVGVIGTDPGIVLTAKKGQDETCVTQNEPHEDRPHIELNRVLVEQKEIFHDHRPYIVIVGGSRNYILEALRDVQLADLFVCCGDHQTLTSLGIPIIDTDWEIGDHRPFELVRGVLYAAHHEVTATDILEAHPAVSSSPSAPPSPMFTPVTPTSDGLRLGSPAVEIALTQAFETIVGYCFGEEPGAWDTKWLKNHPGVIEAPPDISWRKWAYRVYDCTPASDGPALQTQDLLMPVALNVTTGYGSALLERLTSAVPLVNHAMSYADLGRQFWELEADEVDPTNTPKRFSTMWALNTSWAALMAVTGSKLAITHKILHHKWPTLFPLVDNETANFLPEKARWATIHADLTRHQEEFDQLEARFEEVAEKLGGVALKRLRMHDILLWCHATGRDADAMRVGRELLSRNHSTP